MILHSKLWYVRFKNGDVHTVKILANISVNYPDLFILIIWTSFSEKFSMQIRDLNFIVQIATFRAGYFEIFHHNRTSK